MLKTTILLLTCAGLAAPAFAEAPKQSNGKWVDEAGRTLYVFDKDTVPGKSACDAGCAANWPPAVADAYDKAAGDWGFVKTADGKNQWAYKGHPLYRFVMDKKAGDANGDGKMNGMWHIAKP
jgi:predicted lipoprotein with Yx(FWY)xxD motif